MRKIIRWVYALILFVLVVLFGFAVETTADELGFVGVIRATIRGGFSDIVDAGYSEWLLAGILFFGGSWAALLIDGFLRKSAKLVINSEKRVHTVVKNKCSIPDDHIDPRRSAFFMARSILRGIRGGVRAC